MPEVTFQGEEEDASLAGYLLTIESCLLRALDQDFNVSIVVCSPRVMQEQNKAFRDCDEVTDVLSFPLTEDGLFPRQNLLGEILLAPQYIRRQAQLLEVPYLEELCRLCAHGTLHLMGKVHKSYDFKTDPMLIEQEKLVRQVCFLC